MEKSPSPVYGARLELVYALIAHRGFESLLLRHNLRSRKVTEIFVFLSYHKAYLHNRPP